VCVCSGGGAAVVRGAWMVSCGDGCVVCAQCVCVYVVVAGVQVVRRLGGGGCGAMEVCGVVCVALCSVFPAGVCVYVVVAGVQVVCRLGGGVCGGVVVCGGAWAARVACVVCFHQVGVWVRCVVRGVWCVGCGVFLV